MTTTSVTQSKIEAMRINYDSCFLVLYDFNEEEGKLVDLFQGIPLLEDDVIFLLRKHGADIVRVYTDWEKERAPQLIPLYLRRAQRIADSAGYKNEVNIQSIYKPTDDGCEELSKDISGHFIRIK